MEKKFDPREKERKQTNRKKWYKAVCSLAAAIVVCTVYTLMLPALTLDEESAGDAGVTISESSVPTSEAPAAEISKSDNGSESQNDTAADSSADSSHAATESGPAAAAPSDDRAPSTTNPTTEGEHNAPVTLPTEETNSGAITGSSESHDEVTSPDTDDQEKIKDEENNGSPAADKEETDQEEADNSGNSTDADTEEDDSEKSDDTADVEDASYWETTIPDLSDCETWAEKLLAVAGSQLGYHESILNFRVDNDGNHKGYTRYGEWYGNPYGDWCAMFVSFCLKYAGIDSDIIPQNANCQTWVEQLKNNKIFEDPDTYLPEPGDIVFFDQSGSGRADHVGIVSDVEYDTKKVTRHVVVGTETAVEDSPIALLSYANSVLSADIPVETLEAEETEVTVAKNIEVIEGNSSDQVQPVTYDMTDSSILGFASLYEAEYIHDGGDIDDIKNNTQINPPVTLENKDLLAVQAITGANTVVVGNEIPLTGGNSSWNACTDNDKWISDDESIATVSGYGNSATVSGISSGSVTITHTYCNKHDWHMWQHNSSGSEKITITVTEPQEPEGITITGLNEVRMGLSIKLNVIFTPEGSYSSSVRWESSDESIATVDQNGNVSGLKAGTATITASTIGESGTVLSDTHDVAVNKKETDKSQFYYLKTPKSDPDSNDTSHWGSNMGTGSVDTTGATWSKDKNIFDGEIKVVDRVVSWPDNCGNVNADGSLTVSRDSTHWKIIFDAFKTSVNTDYGSITESDVTEIILHPYKISRSNGTNPDKHVDCRVEIKCKGIVNATYFLWDTESNGYEQKASEDYKANSGLTTSYTDFDKTKDLPATKKVGNREYKLVGWYDNPELTGSPVQFPYTMQNENVKFYAKYIEIDYNVNYAIASGCSGYGKINGNIITVTENLSGKETADGCTATPNDGYTFDGWYTDATCTTKVPDSWVVDGKIIPEKTNDSWKEISGKTFYAKFVSGVELPETGGPGTTLLYLLGAMLITAPLTITFIKRRRKENEEN